MKIFLFNYLGETDFVCAENVIKALIAHSDVTGMVLSDYEEYDIQELPRKKWSQYTVTGENTSTTFKDYVSDLKSAEVFSSTAWIQN